MRNRIGVFLVLDEPERDGIFVETRIAAESTALIAAASASPPPPMEKDGVLNAMAVMIPKERRVLRIVSSCD